MCHPLQRQRRAQDTPPIPDLQYPPVHSPLKYEVVVVCFNKQWLRRIQKDATLGASVARQAASQSARRTPRLLQFRTRQESTGCNWMARIDNNGSGPKTNRIECSAVKSESAGPKVDQPNRKALLLPNQTERQRHNVHGK
uniref:HDC14646 n=1 Tax=Drosophila melanogaster TaxID=7227 RepID=Q6IJL3_DROME|nr:TPA_inf: HDC14646 [Drosophila melanogaster]